MDTTGVRVVADTIEFLYGLIFTENKDIDGNPTYEIEVALCNCCLNFKYSLSGLYPDINYVLKLTYHVADDYYGTSLTEN